LRFVRPVIDRVGTSRVVIAWSTYDLTDDLNALGFTGMGMHARSAQASVPAGLAASESPSAYDALEALFDRLQPSAALVLEGNHPWDEATNRVAGQRGIPCFCLQHGWSPIVHSGFRNMTFAEMLVWGDGFAEMLEPYNPGLAFRAVGNPVLEAALPQHDLHCDPAVAFFLQAESPLISSDHLGELHALIREFARRVPEARAIVREHPSSPLSDAQRAAFDELPNVELSLPSESELADVLGASIASVSIYSTTILESIALSVPPIVFNPTTLPRFFPDVDGAGAGREVRTVGAALAELERLVRDRQHHASYASALHDFTRRFFAACGAAAAEAVAERLRTA